LVGAFKTDQALALIKQYFENIPSQPAPPVPDPTEPEQKAERRKTIEDPFAQTPRLDIVYKVPAGNTPDSYALQVLGQVLSGGLSSRLYQKFVKDRELALSISAGPDERRGPSLFWVSVMPKPGISLADIEKLVYEELERTKTEPVLDWELEKVRTQVRRQRAQSFYSTRTRANTLGIYTVYYNDPGLINSLQEKIMKVSKDDLQRVANTYFKESNRTVVATLPKAKPASPTATIHR
jgi:zinc protease